MKKIINIAVIAHVDHGKTTLIGHMIKQGNVLHKSQGIEDRAMDSNDLEKERGITILAKCASISYKDYKINIIDTPGHADFGGEVERILSMADSVLLLVDASEGPMPQSKFVLFKALKVGLKPIVIINKIDRQDQRVSEVLDEIFDLFICQNATDEQIDFPVIYAVGRDGWCTDNMNKKQKDLTTLFEAIIHNVKPKELNSQAPFKMLVTLLDKDQFLGRLLIGKISSGTITSGETIKALDVHSQVVETARINKIQSFVGMNRTVIDQAVAGDIVCISGMDEASVSHTLCDPSVTTPIKAEEVDPPTMSIQISVNSSPLAGKDGNKVTSTLIKERLLAEAETNVAITFKEHKENAVFEIGGRGELQLGILIENMRREGFELSIGSPKVLLKKDENNRTLEPIEEVVIEVDQEHSGVVIEKLGIKKGKLLDMVPTNNRTKLTFLVPSRGLIGYQSEFLSDTKGTGIINRLFHGYEPYLGELSISPKGVLISNAQGNATGYSIFNVQTRGTMFIKPNDIIYEGMIVGENSRENDLEVNIIKGKQLTNVRASGTDKAIILTPPKIMSLEEMIAYIDDDELVEVTPKAIRLRKKFLTGTERKRNSRKTIG